MPTFEEFKELVKKEYLDPNWVINESEKLRYFDSEEAQNHIKSEYESAVEDFKNGKLGEEGFRVGVVTGVANCLYMMWE